jgi:ABC-type multidrug transport system fused ATPase/permease subunit
MLEDAMSKHNHHRKGLSAELRTLGKRGRQVWRLIPRRHKLALGGAALVMALVSACNTALPILLGRLVDAILQEMHQGLGHEALYRTAPSAEPHLVPGRPAVEIGGLEVEYVTPHGKHARALDGISLAIRHGETIGVAGRSGCGKTTWLKVLMRLTHPCGGRVALGSVPLDNVSRAAISRLVG